jgi:hypothetical protein
VQLQNDLLLQVWPAVTGAPLDALRVASSAELHSKLLKYTIILQTVGKNNIQLNFNFFPIGTGDMSETV